MEFESAARRLAKDKKKLFSRKTVDISEKARKQAEYAKLKQKRLAEERATKLRQREHQTSYMNQCDRSLGVQILTSESAGLKATSIHGEGDKIALPPSFLERLSSENEMSNGSPWAFRIGIRNPDYEFPASDLMKNIKVPEEESDEESDDEEDLVTAAYLDELSCRYLSYTYGSVIEFTQEEGFIGIPESISSILVNGNVTAYRTKDPAAAAEPDDDEVMPDAEETKTSGHLAWGAFDIPDLPIEVCLIRLPKGKACTLVPSLEAVQNGFYNLKDVKLVLEQSFGRARATLSTGDLLHTWHRGKKFDMTVRDVSPPLFNAVMCINTDIEVSFGPLEGMTPPQDAPADPSARTENSTGRRLNDDSPYPVTQSHTEVPSTVDTAVLPPEPPVDQTNAICLVQIKSDGAQGRRRFDVRKNTVRQLFAFASSLMAGDVSFRLVTRFPRRVLDHSKLSLCLEEAGITSDRELFLVERL